MQERCWYGLLCATITKRRNVAATREVDGNQIGCAQAGIILLKRPSQPPSLNPHDRIGLRVEVLPPSERLDGNRVAFDASPLPTQCRLDDEPKKSGKLRRHPEHIARDNPRERGVDLRPRWIIAKLVFRVDGFRGPLFCCGLRSDAPNLQLCHSNASSIPSVTSTHELK